MRIRSSTLFTACVIVSVAMAGTYAFQDWPSTWLWRVFMIPIWQPWFTVIMLGGGLHGGGEAWYDPLLVFVFALLYWVILIEAGRWLWRRWRM